MTPTATILVVAAPLMIWRLYSRMRRLIGRQPVRAWRSWMAATLFPLLLILLLNASLGKPLSLGALACGMSIGIGLALWGLKLTRYEATPEGLFYTPNAHIGIALSLLFTGRILYRFIQLYEAGAVNNQPRPEDFSNSPITLLIFGMLAAYFAAYAIGILRWRHSLRAAS